MTAHYVKNRLKYKKLIILFFNYGQRTVKQERYFSKKCAKNLNAEFEEAILPELKKLSTSLLNSNVKAKTIKRNQLKNTSKESLKWYVPCRNLIFLSYALALAESLYIKNKEKYGIFIGFKNEGKEFYPDATSKFIEQINNLQKTVTNKGIKIIAPLINKDKEEIIKIGKKLDINFNETYSCYSGAKTNNIHCGYCLSCRLRKEGFYWSGIKDPTIYAKK